VERLYNFYTEGVSIMSTPLKTLIQWVYSFLLVAVFIGLSGWGLVIIPVVGSLLDPTPNNSMFWQQLMGVRVVWIRIVECCAAIAALLVFGLCVELVVWRHNRRCAPRTSIDSDNLLRLPPRKQWRMLLHGATVLATLALIMVGGIILTSPDFRGQQWIVPCTALLAAALLVGELALLFVDEGRNEAMQV
jgi:hypothetical protein